MSDQTDRKDGPAKGTGLASSATKDCNCGCADCAEKKATANKSRRRFTQAGLVAPVILSLAGRPVWGSHGACSLSGDIFSANVSNIDHECTPGNGCTPGFWRNNYRAWDCTGWSPGTCLEWNPPENKCQELDATTGTTFMSVFGMDSTCLPGATLMEVLQECSGSLDWHAVGSVLNAQCSSVAFGATVDEVVKAYQMALSGLADPHVLKEVFDNMNNRGCPINAFGECEKNYSKNEVGECIFVRTSITDN